MGSGSGMCWLGAAWCWRRWRVGSGVGAKVGVGAQLKAAIVFAGGGFGGKLRRRNRVLVGVDGE
jgi:hypothetical protein